MAEAAVQDLVILASVYLGCVFGIWLLRKKPVNPV
jgi:hypothetical protein